MGITLITLFGRSCYRITKPQFAGTYKPIRPGVNSLSKSRRDFQARAPRTQAGKSNHTDRWSSQREPGHSWVARGCPSFPSLECLFGLALLSFTIPTTGNYPDKCGPGLVIAASIMLTLRVVGRGELTSRRMVIGFQSLRVRNMLRLPTASPAARAK